METKKKFPPREGDIPVEELSVRATAKILLDHDCGITTDIYFKFTCENCGERCAFAEPNRLYEFGECHKCGHQTKVVVGGFTTVSKM